MVLCLPTKFHLNEAIVNGVMKSYRSLKWQSRCPKSTSGFLFGDDSHLRRSKIIRVPNFVNISQSAAEILPLSLSENKRPPFWNCTSGFHVDVLIVTVYQISSKSDHQRRSYDVMAIFKMAAVSHVEFALGQSLTIHELHLMVWILSSNFGLVGFIVSEIGRLLYFAELAGKCLFTTNFKKVLGRNSQTTASIVLSPKSPSFSGNTSFEP